jgi:hypothetical protein
LGGEEGGGRKQASYLSESVVGEEAGPRAGGSAAGKASIEVVWYMCLPHRK